MKLYLKQKAISFGEKFTVRDENGQERYWVEGSVFSFIKKLRIYDKHFQEIAAIHQKFWSWPPGYRVLIREREVACVQSKLTLLYPRYTVEQLGWEVSGHFLEHDYTIAQNGETLATISKKWMSWGDSYQLEITDPANELTALAVVLAIDCIKAS